MKTDRELLEMAAKAAGYTHLRYCKTHMAMVPEPEGEEALPFSVWNPLTDDGDALRLAVMLKIRIGASSKTRRWATRPKPGRFIESCAPHHGNKDEYAATRRAIVRAAAAIGEGME